MGSSRISNIKPPCGYTIAGINEILLLDFEDFSAFKFYADNLYDNCKVIEILRSGDFKELEAPDLTAKYASNLTNGIYAHSLETFVSELSAETMESLHLATKRRQIPVFKTLVGKYYTFGYEAGASVTYVNQTADAIGSLVTISAASIYPLFEVAKEAVTVLTRATEYDPDFINGSFCETV